MSGEPPYWLATHGSAPCVVVAELGNAHNGEYDRAIRLLDAAKVVGCSAAKLQCYSVEELTALRGDGPAPDAWGEAGMSMGDLYSKAMTPREWFAPLYAHAASIGLPIFSSVFGEESLALLESIGNPCYKIAALDRLSAELRAAVLATGKPIITSTPNGKLYSAREGDLWLHCPPGYPQIAPFFRWDAFENDEPDYAVDGFSYHGTDPLPCVVAATLGATMIEFHLHLADEPSELEANVSLTEIQAAQMINDVRRIEAMLG